MSEFKRIIVTGATGFLGSHLTRRLVQEGFAVGIIKKRDSDLRRLQDVLSKIECLDVDLRDTQKISKTISHYRPDAVYHLAAYYAVEHDLKQIPLILDVNLLGTINLLEALKNCRPSLFVNTSSCFVYKQTGNKVDENAAIGPVNLYGLAKFQSETACTFYAEKYDVRTVTFRLFPAYGPADHERRLIPYIIKCLLNNETPKLTSGEQKWDFVYADDIVTAYVQLLSLPRLPDKHEIFNIGTGRAVSIREIAACLSQRLENNAVFAWDAVPHRKNEPWIIRANTDKCRKMLGWEPKIQMLDQGIELTVQWYKKYWNH